MGHRANGRIGTAECRRGTRGCALDELPDGLISKVLAGVSLGDRDEHAFARMLPRETEDALNQPNGADAAGRQRRVGPVLEGRADALALTNETIDKRLLPRRGLGLAGARRIHTLAHAGMNRNERVVRESTDYVSVPADADSLAE